jgi:hypothetical protein
LLQSALLPNPGRFLLFSCVTNNLAPNHMAR